MLNLLITDDEPLIHVIIEYNLNSIPDVNIKVQHAYNGLEMLRIMETAPFDIALVDIRMPGMDGLTAIESAGKLYPKTRFYIMSGYSEFEYARQAVHLGVVDYLLKPLEKKQLEKIISDTQMDLIRNQEQIMDNMKAWLAGTLHRHDVSYLYDTNYSSAIVLICDNHEINDIPTLPTAATVCSLECREGILLLIYSQTPNFVRDSLRSFPRNGYPLGITCFTSSISSDPSELASDLHKITDICPVRVYLGIGKRFDLDQIPTMENLHFEECQEWVVLRESYQKKEYTDFVSSIDKLITATLSLSKLYLQSLRIFISTYFNIDSSQLCNIESMRSSFQKIAETMLEHEVGKDRMDSVIAFVDEHYANDISINKLAARFDFTPNYLSSLFKKHTGVNFVEYLTILRLRKAKTLLSLGNLSIGEIGESVGYYSQSYFTKTFIKHEGCTPGEYRAKKNGSGN